ncbi:hypothetical protein E2320_003298 [Naja naja]|nr:hypothetical protein E2320_003298 [Naja naja]
MADVCLQSKTSYTHAEIPDERIDRSYPRLFLDQSPPPESGRGSSACLDAGDGGNRVGFVLCVSGGLFPLKPLEAFLCVSLPTSAFALHPPFLASVLPPGS